MKKYTHIARAALSQPWAIYGQSSAWRAITELLSRRMAGEPLSDEEIDERLAAERDENGERDWLARLEAFGAIPATEGAAARVGVQLIPIQAARARRLTRAADEPQTYTAVLPIHGVLLPRVGAMERMSGATAVPDLHAAFNAAVRDDSVDSIILDVDSPGGMIDQIPEFAAAIYGARGTKPIVAIADTMAASAAYWLATQADEVSISPSAVVGSVGAFMHHENWEKFYAEEGVEHTFITYGEHKAEGNPYQPLSDHARERMQHIVDYYGTRFDAAVAQGRGVTPEHVREHYGQGDVFPAEDAVRLGMADRIETIGELVDRMAASAGAPRVATSAAVARSRISVDEASQDLAVAIPTWKFAAEDPDAETAQDDAPAADESEDVRTPAEVEAAVYRARMAGLTRTS